MARKWTKYYMREQFPALVREQRIEQGLDPRIKPTHEWLRENGHRQFLRRARELGYTPDEFLLEKCGFEPPQAEFPCDDSELEEEIEQWLEYEANVNDRINGGSIDDARSHLRQIMKIAEEYAGTSNLLKFGRGERGVCTNRAMLLMRGLAQEFENGGTRRNYVTTFRDFMQHKFDEDVIEHDPITPLVDRSGWTHERSRPKYVPSTSLVRSYYEACETLVEQMVILSLAGFGLRGSDSEDEDLDDLLVLDAEIPHLAFSKDRKNGVGRVPIVKGLAVVEEYRSRLKEDPNYNGSVFPSDQRECGSRCPQWIRDTVERIGERTDATLENGKKPTPKHFRQFWYTHFLTAWSEWLDRGDKVGEMQGTSSPRSAISYSGDTPWFNTYLTYVEPIMAEAFPAHMDETIADELGNVDVSPQPTGQLGLDVFSDRNLATLGPQGYVAAAVAIPTKIAEEAVTAWAATKHTVLTIHPGFEYYPLDRMPRERKVGLVGGIALVIATWISVLHLNGILGDLFSGDPLTVLSLVIALVIGFYHVEQDIPTIEEAVQAAEQQDSQ